MQRTDYNAVEFVRQMLSEAIYSVCFFSFHFLVFFLLLMHHNSNLHILKVNTEGITCHVNSFKFTKKTQ